MAVGFFRSDSFDPASPGEIGGTTPGAGAFTTLDLADILTLTDGRIRPDADANPSMRIQTLSGTDVLTFNTTSGFSNFTGGIFLNRTTLDPFFIVQKDGTNVFQLRGKSGGGAYIRTGDNLTTLLDLDANSSTWYLPFRPDTDSTSALEFQTSGGTDVLVMDTTNNRIIIPNMPTSDPLVAGALWNDSGTAKISAG